ncbi:MAG: ATP-binding protein [Candidatus Binatia bacterium]
MDIETFAHIVAHDLKAPLNGIASMVDIVVEDYGDRLDDDGRAQLRLLQSLAGRGVALIDGLRRYTRVTSAPVQLRSLDLTTLAHRAVAQAARLVPDVTVRAEVAPLPAVQADPALIPDLLAALCANAVVFHTGLERVVRVAPLADPGRALPPGHVAIGVRDEGIGIDPKQHTAIFDMFKRLHAPDKFGGGAGAGLAVARAIVERHGGAIWVADSSTRGTTIAFTLPAAPATPEA